MFKYTTIPVTLLASLQERTLALRQKTKLQKGDDIADVVDKSLEKAESKITKAFKKLQKEHDDLKKEFAKLKETCTVKVNEAPPPEPPVVQSREGAGRILGKVTTPPQPSVVDAKITQEAIKGPSSDKLTKPITEHMGPMKKEQSSEVYFAPQSKTGRPDQVTGFDYLKYGENWMSLGSCGSSPELQSPINIVTQDMPSQTKGVLWFDYYKDSRVADQSELSFHNAGHGLFVDLQSSEFEFGSVQLVNSEYVAEEVMFHTPSEHQLGGVTYPLEIQIYHRDKENKNTIMAISVLFEEHDHGDNAYLQALVDGQVDAVWTLENYAASSNITGKNAGRAFNIENLIPTLVAQQSGLDHPLNFYSYVGSETMPPCTAGVEWMVAKIPMKASREQIQFVENLVMSSESSPHGNNRPVFPVGKRMIQNLGSNRKHHIPQPHKFYPVDPSRTHSYGVDNNHPTLEHPKN